MSYFLKKVYENKTKMTEIWSDTFWSNRNIILHISFCLEKLGILTTARQEKQKRHINAEKRIMHVSSTSCEREW